MIRGLNIVFVALGLALSNQSGAEPSAAGSSAAESSAAESSIVETRTAVFAGGCFWCMEPPFDELNGVLETVSGYAGGHVIAPTYRDVTGGRSGHLEVLQVVYDPKRVGYQDLLDVFWRNVDPLDAGGQFCDRGESYTTAIFTSSERENALAKRSKIEIQKQLGKPIATTIREITLKGFYPAEDYHQDYYQKNPLRYKFYRASCGRDKRLEQVWGENS